MNAQSVRNLSNALLLACLPCLAACEAFVWGGNDNGQRGVGVFGGGGTFKTPILGTPRWFILEAGRYHNCGIQIDGTLWCWGKNDHGQVGDGTAGTDRAAPVKIGAATDWKSVAPGDSHTCGIRGTGQLWCWGRNGNGQLGDGLLSDSHVPKRIGSASNWAVVTVGALHTCGLRAQAAYCWGWNFFGQLGTGDKTQQVSPTPVAYGAWKHIDAGVSHTCAIGLNDLVWCWGNNAGRQASRNSSVDAQTSPLVYLSELWSGGELVAAFAQDVAAAEHYTCIHFEGNPDISGRVACLGGVGSAVDLTGNDGEDDFFVRAPEGSFPIFRQMDASYSHACGVESGSKRALCWGNNDADQLGTLGPVLDRAVEVSGSMEWFKVSVGQDHTIGLEEPAID